MEYVHNRADWPTFRYDLAAISEALAATRHSQGLLLGKMSGLGFGARGETTLESLTEEVHQSSEIEGEKLDRNQVRSSVARRLGMDKVIAPSDPHIDGVVEMLLDAGLKFDAPLTQQRLFNWHAALFPTGRSGMTPITVGGWRSDSDGAMMVVSGSIGREKVHYIAPKASRVDAEMNAFLTWFESQSPIDPVVKAAIAHLWFVTIHPFDDGNGRIARAIADMALARSEKSPQRFYSMSGQIRKEQKAYYEILEASQKGNLDITLWLNWFIDCLGRAIETALRGIEATILKARLWDSLSTAQLNDRQRLILNKLADGFEGNLTTIKWAKIAKCSHDTALRDINDLIAKGVFIKTPAGGRSASYRLTSPPTENE